MKRKILAVLCVVCVIAVSAGALSINNDPSPKDRKQASKQALPSNVVAEAASGTQQSPQPANAPEYVIYRQFFRHLMALKVRAGELERQGRNGQKLRTHYQDLARLTDEQARLLDRVAADCDREVALQDAQAQIIITAFRARFPGDRVPPGQQLPPPPPELRRMQQQRNNIIMRARYRLRVALGEQGFRQLDDFIKINVAPRISPAQLQGGASASSQPETAQ